MLEIQTEWIPPTALFWPNVLIEVRASLIDQDV
jgi:hypothetical protein